MMIRYVELLIFFLEYSYRLYYMNIDYFLNSNVIIQDDMEKRYEKGLEEEQRFKSYMINKYNIEFIQYPRYSTYDFTYSLNPNVYIEFKHLELKTFDKDGNIIYYDDIMLGEYKILYFLDMFNQGLKKNKLLQFYYAICLWYLKDGKKIRIYKYCYLDLNFIVNKLKPDNSKSANIVYYIKYKWFKNISGLKTILNHNKP